MIARWAEYKRHFAFSRHSEYREQGSIQKSPGTPSARRIYMSPGGAAKCWRSIGIHEQANSEAVNYFLNRSKVNVLWSRREGVNPRHEGMFAGTPCIVGGFNFGFHYIYQLINWPVARRKLCYTLIEMIETHTQYRLISGS